MASVDSASFESVLSCIGSNNPVKQMKHIVERDRTRAQKLMNGIQPHGPLAVKELKENAGRRGGHGGDKPSTEGQNYKSVDVTDCAVTYVMSVGIGDPATPYKLLIDTGSSNTWIGAHQEYKPTRTSQTQRNAVNVTYGSGSFVGTEYTDNVTLSPNMVIRNQSIGVAQHAEGFENDRIDGILGIGPVDLTRGTVDNMVDVPTITNNMRGQGIIETESIGIYYAPTPADSTGLANGELTFGGVDEKKITTPVKYVPVTKTFPASRYWGINQTIKYDGNAIMNHCAGIVDTGTTLIMLATDTFEKYRKATGATMDSNTGLLCVTAEQFKNMKNLEFHIGENTYELTPNAQIWPRAMNEMLGGAANKIYLVFADIGQPCGSGLDFINGFTFLQRFYSVYDTTNSQIGFAETKYTRAETN
ncbi:acid protease [Marasmius fiardii PR-910]|nr:acid protease [Marasmius fiardii PR-910]